MRYDWKFANKNPRSNSGLLVHIQPPHKVWPTCIEVQGMQGDHGHILQVGAAKAKIGPLNKDGQKQAIKLGEWNTTEVLVKDGKIASKINGVAINACTTDLMEGPFGFQSEGAELYLKNIKIKVLE